MSDSLALSNQIAAKMAGGELEIPRYIDLFKQKNKAPEETPEQIISRFDKLRRR